jgi:hypothetical protein
MGNLDFVARRCSPVFRLKIRLGGFLDVAPELVAAALGCSLTTVKRRQGDLPRAARERGVDLGDPRAADGLLRAMYREEGGGGAAREAGWREVCGEAQVELLNALDGCCEETRDALEGVDFAALWTWRLPRAPGEAAGSGLR